jgi:AmpE protein
VTLFSLLIVMALERVTSKSKQFHIANIAQSYFSILLNKGWVSKKADMAAALLLALVPTLIALVLVNALPMLIVFLVNLIVLWICLGCPVTRQTYKRYLQAANQEDFQACALHSMSFGNEGGDLNNVGKQLVLVNYRQYASVIIFFVVLGVPGVVFYSLIKEWVLYQARETSSELDTDTQCSMDASARIDDIEPEVVKDNNSESAASKILFILDWIPVRVTAFGFLIVGHFTNALSAWFEIVFHPTISTYDALAKVSKAAEDVGDCDSHLNEPLQLVKLVKRNVVFILMAVSVLTLIGLVA